jgi:hypothetical protein
MLEILKTLNKDVKFKIPFRIIACVYLCKRFPLSMQTFSIVFKYFKYAVSRVFFKVIDQGEVAFNASLVHTV